MNESKPDINKVLFMHLVSMLAMSAIQQMGKLVDPGTGKAEINLEAAQATIDMLDMLEARTHGNLDAEETRLLKDTLMSLKMNYVQSQDQKTDDGQRTPDARPEKTDGEADARRQTTDSGEKQAESGTEDGRQTPDARRQTPENGHKKADSGADDGRQTTEDGPAKTGDKADDRHQTPDTGHQTSGGGAEDGPAKTEDGNKEKTPKYHKKYE